MQLFSLSDEERAPVAAPPPEDVARAGLIGFHIGALSRAFRERHPVLDRNQSLLGLLWLFVSLVLMVGAALAYADGALPAWATIGIVAFACSIAHELEHDLIHGLYFAHAPRVRDLMLAVGWLMRPSTVNPWIRAALHLQHHRASGTPSDIEERSITLGEPWGLKRLFMTADGFVAMFLRLPFTRPFLAWKVVRRSAVAYGPLAWIYHLCLLGFLYLHLRQWQHTLTLDMEQLLPALDFLAVAWVLPNLLRTFCLHLVSSNIHYYGDVLEGDVLRQVQVIDRWYFLPFQLFCCNFGSTHAIHHFWVSEPFYIRQLTAAAARRVLRAHGVRFNDLATFARANRYGPMRARPSPVLRLLPLATR
jgi:fatty acid desaturase